MKTGVDNRVEPVEYPEVSIANINNEIQPSIYPLENSDKTDNTNSVDESRNDDQEENIDGNSNYLKCYCGKKCKGPRHLQAKKRACRYLTIPDLKPLYENPPQLVEEDPELNRNAIYVPSEKFSILKSVKLPKTQKKWELLCSHTSLFTYPMLKK